MSRNEGRAQAIILKRSGAIRIREGHSEITEKFQVHAKTFRELRNNKYTFVEIDKQLRG